MKYEALIKRVLPYVYGLFAACYVVLSYVYPSDQHTLLKQHLTVPHARLISMSIAVLMIAIWAVAYRVSERVWEYGTSIRRNVDGPPFVILGGALRILAIYLPVRMVSKLSLNYLASLHPSWLGITNTIISYINLIFPLVAFVLIGQAAQKLAELAKVKPSLFSLYGNALIFNSLGVLYCYTVFSVHGTAPSTSWFVTTQQQIPMFIRVITLVIPYIFMWFVGIRAAHQIYLYQIHAKGIFYRMSLKWLSIGLLGIIMTTIFLQFLTATAANLQNLKFRAILIIAYTIILLLGASFLIMAKGLRKLKLIDQV